MARKRRISVRGVRKEKPDIRRLGRAIIELAQAQAETEAQAEDAQRRAQSGISAERERRSEPSAAADEPVTGDAA